MPETRKNRKIIIIVLIVVILAAIGVFVWWQFFRAVPEEELIVNRQPTTNTVTVVNVNTSTVVNRNVNIQVTEQIEMTRLANLFAERFGSYSSESEFQNTIDLKPYMTNKMKSWTDSYISFQLTTPSAGFSSITTKVITTKIVSQDDSQATVELMTLRIEEGSNINGQNSYNQGITLELVKEGDKWLVDKATWQAK